MTEGTDEIAPTGLRPLEKRPSAYNGGAGPYDLQRWLRTHAVDRIEFAPDGESVRLHSGRGHATTPFACYLNLGPSTTIDGEKTLVGPVSWVCDLVDEMIRWERRNPDERPFGVATIDPDVMRVSAAHLLGLPAGPQRIGQVDRLLSLMPEDWISEKLRLQLRSDPHDADGTSAVVISKITDL